MRTVLVAVAMSCSGGTLFPGPPEVTAVSIRVVAGNGGTATASTALGTNPTVQVLDSEGLAVAGAVVQFSVTSGDGWTVTASATSDGSGLASTTWYLGPVAGSPQELSVTSGNAHVTFAAAATRPAAGSVILGANDYIEWLPGDLPLVVTAPHGGSAAPSTIPDRPSGTTTRDLNTDELARTVSDAFFTRLGKRPHVVICRLHRRKLDANREIIEAAAGNAAAERAWREYHGFIEAATAEVRLKPGVGFLVDLHGHGHAIQRLELGYLLDAATLSLSDAQFNAPAIAASSSLQALVSTSSVPLASLVRGAGSLGARLETAGFPSVPSPSTPSPGTAPFFDGGYSTQRHAAAADGRFAGVQLEANLDGVRDTPSSRAAFSSALAASLDTFLRDHGSALSRRGAPATR